MSCLAREGLNVLPGISDHYGLDSRAMSFKFWFYLDLLPTSVLPNNVFLFSWAPKVDWVLHIPAETCREFYERREFMKNCLLVGKFHLKQV